MKKSKLLLIGICAGFVLFLFLSAIKAGMVEPENAMVARGAPSITIAGQTFNTEIANTEETRKRGLSGRSALAADEAMLFVFDKPAAYAFWMKDMKFSIDIIWIDADKRVVHIEKSVSPDTYPAGFAPSRDALYVFEVRAGTADRLKIKQGDSVEVSL